MVGEPNFVWYASQDDTGRLPGAVCSRIEKPADVSTSSYNGFIRVMKLLTRLPIVP